MEQPILSVDECSTFTPKPANDPMVWLVAAGFTNELYERLGDDVTGNVVTIRPKDRSRKLIIVGNPGCTPEKSIVYSAMWAHFKDEYDVIGIDAIDLGPLAGWSVYGLCHLHHQVSAVHPEPRLLCTGPIDPIAVDHLLYSIPNSGQFAMSNGGYLASVNIKTLRSISFDWKETRLQRPLDKTHYQQIAAELTDEYLRTGGITLLGCLIVGIYKYKYHIIDGQHRLEAYKEFHHRTSGRFDFDIPVQVIIYDRWDDIHRHFNTFNFKKLSYTQSDEHAFAAAKEGVNVLTGSQTIAKELYDRIRNKWKGMTSHKPTKAPYLYGDEVEAKLAELIANSDHYTADIAWYKLNEKNTVLSQQKTWLTKLTKKPYTERSLVPCRESGLYLGLINVEEWLS